VYIQTCPRCGRDFEDESAEVVADAVVAHATVQHQHHLDRDIVLAHLRGAHPFNDD
jgi:hypothetical protein